MMKCIMCFEWQEHVLGGYPSPPLDKKARHASEKASGGAGEALMNLAAVMNIPDKSMNKRCTLYYLTFSLSRLYRR